MLILNAPPEVNAGYKSKHGSRVKTLSRSTGNALKLWNFWNYSLTRLLKYSQTRLDTSSPETCG